MKKQFIILTVLVVLSVALPCMVFSASFFDLKITKHSWKKGGFGTVALHTITIKNESASAMKNIVLLFTYYSDSDRVLTARTFTLYKKIPKGKTVKFTDINVGFIHDQVTGCDVKIVGAEIIK